MAIAYSRFGFKQRNTEQKFCYKDLFPSQNTPEHRLRFTFQRCYTVLHCWPGAVDTNTQHQVRTTFIQSTNFNLRICSIHQYGLQPHAPFRVLSFLLILPSSDFIFAKPFDFSRALRAGLRTASASWTTTASALPGGDSMSSKTVPAKK